jgi:hypothetical protein
VSRRKDEIGVLVVGGLLILSSLVFAGARERTTAEIKGEIMDIGYANVREFQKTWGLEVDGLIGPETLGKLKKAKRHYKKDERKRAKQERKDSKQREALENKRDKEAERKAKRTKEVEIKKREEPVKKIEAPRKIISLTKEERQEIDRFSKEDKTLLALSEREQIALAIKNNSQVYRLEAERSIALRKLWTPSLSAEYGHEIIDRDRLDSFRRGQEESTYWIKYDFMEIFDNTKRARSYKVERGTFKHKIRCDVRELRGKIRLTEQKVNKCRNDYARVQKNYKELIKQLVNPPERERIVIQHSQDSQRLYLTLKRVEQELLGYQYTLLALIRGHGRVGYIK